MNKILHIAIDGPVAAGKGTVAKKLAERLDILYVDTGAMYRAVALIGIRHNISLTNEDALVERTMATQLEMRNPTNAEQDGRQTTIIADGDDISWDIRTEEVSQGSSVVAAHPKIRQVLVTKQQEIAKGQSVVMEGRDITYRVLPQADLKIYLTASPEERARRRTEQLRQRGIEADFSTVLVNLQQRDKQDMSRDADPLKITKDTWVLDTSTLSIEEVVDKIIDQLE